MTNKFRLLTFAYSLLIVCLTLSGQKIDKEHLSIAVRGRYSHVLDGHNIYRDLIDSHNFCTFDAAVGLSTRPEDGGS